MIEIWRDIKDYEGLYQVSNFGRVRSLVTDSHRRKRILKQSFRGYYLKVKLIKDNKQKIVSVHRLVAEAFLPNPLNLPCVNHKDENKTNNSVDNLEWCDYRYNTNYGTANKRRSKVMTNGKQSKPVLQFTKTGDFIREWPSTSEINRQLGYNVGNISHCCLGNTRLKTYKGYIWKYKETL